ncbi:hypothetical protein NC652_027543 [Populus alba x Populus x berolinensis]|nr:hypothetical protein NC652_027543 [Populus alba x Populus x berolinensis]
MKKWGVVARHACVSLPSKVAVTVMEFSSSSRNLVCN